MYIKNKKTKNILKTLCQRKGQLFNYCIILFESSFIWIFNLLHSFCVSKNKCIQIGEINNKVEDTIFFYLHFTDVIPQRHFLKKVTWKYDITGITGIFTAKRISNYLDSASVSFQCLEEIKIAELGSWSTSIPWKIQDDQHHTTASPA